MNMILEALVIVMAINLLLFIPAYFFQSDKLTDLSYALSFIVLALFGFSKSDKQAIDIVLMTLTLVWALRLGGFLFIRILKEGKDSRFDKMRKKWTSFLRFWFFQGLSVFIIILPGILVWNSHKNENILIFIGVGIWLTGLAVEYTADYQKYRFKLMGAKSWIDKGIWRASRHPNYLGEIIVWVGFYVTAFTALVSLDRFYALASPVYITLILLFFSGVPLLEKSADKKWGGINDYEQYKKEVPLLVPSLPSLRRALKKV